MLKKIIKKNINCDFLLFKNYCIFLNNKCVNKIKLNYK